MALAGLAPYIFLTTWRYIYQRSDLPKGMPARTFAGIGLACLMMWGVVLLGNVKLLEHGGDQHEGHCHHHD